MLRGSGQDSHSHESPDQTVSTTKLDAPYTTISFKMSSREPKSHRMANKYASQELDVTSQDVASAEFEAAGNTKVKKPKSKEAKNSALRDEVLETPTRMPPH